MPHATPVNGNPSIHHNTRILIISNLFLFIEIKIKILKEMNTKYVTALKKYESKANVCLCKIKLADNINFFYYFNVSRLEIFKTRLSTDSVCICVEFEN